MLDRLDFLKMSVTALSGLSVGQLTDEHDEWLFDRELEEEKPQDETEVFHWVTVRAYGRPTMGVVISTGEVKDRVLCEDTILCKGEDVEGANEFGLFTGEMGHEVFFEAHENFVVNKITAAVTLPGFDGEVESNCPMPGGTIKLYKGDTLTMQFPRQIMSFLP